MNVQPISESVTAFRISHTRGQKFIDLLIVLAVVFLVIFLSGVVVELLDIFFLGSFIDRIDPHNYFFRHILISLCSLGFVLLAIRLFRRGSFAEWGFNLNEFRFSLKLLPLFCLVYTPIIFFTKVIPDARAEAAAGVDIDTVGIIGSVVHTLIISGMHQEVLFRGFIMVFLARSWPGIWRIGRIEVPHTALWATIFFLFAHLRWNQEPFFYWWQMAWSAVLGLYYALVFHKTKSLLNPILAHNYSNGVFVILLIIMSLVYSGQL